MRMRGAALRALMVAGLAVMAWVGFQPTAGASGLPKVSAFTLQNGMRVYVLPDHRVPVVTHMVWYQAGAADEPRGKSGLAHLLEHMMFKSSGTLKDGELTKIITRLGGRYGATTSPDATVYFQRVHRSHLPRVMALEADRMVNLSFADKEVESEKKVVQQERNSTVKADVVRTLNEQMLAALYLNHPYGTPSIGWDHEIGALTRDDLIAFYKRHYVPNNAFVVVAGDVDVQEVRKLAEGTFGKIAPSHTAKQGRHAGEPPHIAPRRVELIEPRSKRTGLFRNYLTPSYASAEPGEAEGLDLLAAILGAGETSRLYRTLVSDMKIATTVGATYEGTGRDYGRIVLFASPAKNISLQQVEDAIDDVLADVIANGVTAEELDLAKAVFDAKGVFTSDDQFTRARVFGKAIASGRKADAILAHEQTIGETDLSAVVRAAKTHLQSNKSVTGLLRAQAPMPLSRSAILRKERAP